MSRGVREGGPRERERDGDDDAGVERGGDRERRRRRDVRHAERSEGGDGGGEGRAEGGVSRARTRKKTYVDCSTVDGECGEATREILGERVSFLAAPVSGGWRDAAKGELLFIGGGSREAYDASAAHMEIMGAKRWLVGDTPTHAARAKLMLQIMMGNVIGALGEMHGLSQRAGLDSDAILEMLSHSAMGSALTTAKGKLA